MFEGRGRAFCEIACFVGAMTSALMVSVSDSHPAWIAGTFLAAIAYGVVVHAPLQEEAEEVQARNHVYFNNRARLAFAALFCCVTPWFRPLGGVMAAVEASFLAAMLVRAFKSEDGMPVRDQTRWGPDA